MINAIELNHHFLEKTFTKAYMPPNMAPVTAPPATTPSMLVLLLEDLALRYFFLFLDL